MENNWSCVEESWHSIMDHFEYTQEGIGAVTDVCQREAAEGHSGSADNTTKESSVKREIGFRGALPDLPRKSDLERFFGVPKASERKTAASTAKGGFGFREVLPVTSEESFVEGLLGFREVLPVTSEESFVEGLLGARGALGRAQKSHPRKERENNARRRKESSAFVKQSKQL